MFGVEEFVRDVESFVVDNNDLLVVEELFGDDVGKMIK